MRKKLRAYVAYPFIATAALLLFIGVHTKFGCRVGDRILHSMASAVRRAREEEEQA